MKRSASSLAGFMLFVSLAASALSPDVILGELDGPRLASANSIAAITVGATSCNAGNARKLA